jgi:hypothetical protein
MASKKTSEASSKGKAAVRLSFHERFDIHVGIDEARSRFVNRVRNYIFKNFLEFYGDNGGLRYEVRWRVANALGEVYRDSLGLSDYIRGDFYRCLEAIEASYFRI